MISSIINRVGLFRFCLLVSLFVHVLLFGGYSIANIGKVPANSENLSESDIEVEVDLHEIPPELIGGNENPAPVEKKEWIEGENKSIPEKEDNDENSNAVSGTGSDRDGYLFSFNGDSAPRPIINFNLKKYFPEEGRKSNILKKKVIVLIQVDEWGKLQSAKVISKPSGYGFDEAAMMIIHRVKFVPGYVKGRPAKMVHKLPILFELDDRL